MLTHKQFLQLYVACRMAQSYLPHPNTTFLALMQLAMITSKRPFPESSYFLEELEGFKAKYYPSGFKPNTKPISRHLTEIDRARRKLLPEKVLGRYLYIKEATRLDTVVFLRIMRGCKRYI